MKLRYLVAVGLVSLMLFMLVSAPASLIRPLLNQQAEISAGRLDGSLWNGSADFVDIQGYRLDKLAWQFQPASLLLGKLAVELNARFSEQPIYTIAAATISGSIELADTRASLPAPLVAELAQIPMAQLEGMVSIDLQSAHLERDSLPQAKGTVRWQQAAVTIADTARLGDINIQLTPDGSAYQQAVINNEGGDIALDGTANIEADGAYNIELDMLAGNNASENVRKSLGMFARPRPGGGYQLKHEGNLNDLAL